MSKALRAMGEDGSRPRLLLVDDRRDNLAALVAVLEPLGLELLTASSGSEALRVLLHHEVAAVVLDVQMPEMDGFETAQLLRRRAATRSVPIVFLTAIGHDVENELRSYELGAFDYITKPFDPKVLQGKIKAIVDWSTELRRLAGLRHLYEESGSVLSQARREAMAQTDDEARQALESFITDESGHFVGMRRLLEIDLEMGAEASRDARAALRAAAGSRLADAEDSVLLLMSELVTNAVLHARSNATVRVDLGDRRVRVEVEDRRLRAPQLSTAAVDDETGRGLAMVLQLADRCGWTELADGKIVWFEIALHRDESVAGL